MQTGRRASVAIASNPFRVGLFVWAKSQQVGGLEIHGQVESIVDGNNVRVKTCDGRTEKYPINALRLYDTLQDRQLVDDATSLAEANESQLLNLLRLKYAAEKYFTYVGPMLIMINPNRQLPIYSTDSVQMHAAAFRAGIKLPPHLFEIGNLAYRGIQKKRADRSIIFLGTSASGKSEAAKIITHYLVQIAGSHAIEETRIIDSQTVLEAFGHARTVQNDSANRFGRWQALYFSANRYAIRGSRVVDYKTRVVRQAPFERNFHCFYLMLAGLSQERKEAIKISSQAQYNYLGGRQLPVLNEEEEFKRLELAMESLGFTLSMRQDIFRVLALILHLGNIDFERKNYADNASTVRNRQALQHASSLMVMSMPEIETALTTRSSVTRGERILAPLTCEQAESSRDTLALALYGWLFQWVLRTVNKATASQARDELCINLIDMPGYETYEINTMEQFLNNLASEKIHNLYLHVVFHTERREFEYEGVPWPSSVVAPDSREVMDFLFKAPNGIVPLLIEETLSGRGSDDAWIQRISEVHGQESVAIVTSPDISNLFFVKHHFDTVKYSVDGFIERNRDQLRSDLELVCHMSEFQFIGEIAISWKETELQRRNSTMGAKSTKKMSIVTSASRMESSLTDLVLRVSSQRPLFVHCISPNQVKRPDLFDAEHVFHQLRGFSAIEALTLFKNGFRRRILHEEFVELYGPLVSNARGKQAETAKMILNKVVPDCYKNDWCIGKSRVFLRHELSTWLNDVTRILLNTYCCKIQRFVRYNLALYDHVIQLQSAAVIQGAYRTWKRRQHRRYVNNAASKIQAAFRGRKQREQYYVLLEAVIIVQTVLRQHLADDRIDELMRRRRLGETGDYSLRHSQDVAMVITNTQAKTAKSAVPSLDISWDRIGSPDMQQAFASIQSPFTKSSASLAGSDFVNYDLGKYARAYWTTANCKYDPIPLTQPLLNKLPTEYNVTALAINKCILGFTGDFKFPEDTTKSSMLSFIIENGIRHLPLRDEIYSQLCKHTNEAPEDDRMSLGWCLFALCCACFVPTHKHLNKYITNHIRISAPDICSDYVESFFSRSLKNGTRAFPPSQLELRAIAAMEPIEVQIFIQSNRFEILKVDPATLMSEIVTQITDRMGMQHTNGLCICIHQADFDVPLRGKDHVLDQFARYEAESGLSLSDFSSVPWHFLLRKETLEPEEKIVDPAAIDFVYHQIVDNLPKQRDIENSTMRKIRSISANIEAGNKSNNYHDPKSQVIQLASTIPLMFCSRFAVNPLQDSIDHLPKIDMTPGLMMAVDQNGIHFHIKMSNVVSKTITFSSLRSYQKVPNGFALNAEEVTWTFESVESDEILQIIDRTLQQLKNIAIWAQVIEDYDMESGDAQDLKAELVIIPLKRGEVIELLERNEQRGWFKGRQMRDTRIVGWFPKECVVPLLEKVSFSLRSANVQPTNSSMYSLATERSAENVHSSRLGSQNLEGASSIASIQQHDSPSPNAPSLDDKNGMLKWAMSTFRYKTEKKGLLARSFLLRNKTKVNEDNPREVTSQQIAQFSEAISFTKVPIKASLMKLDSEEDNKLAVTIFKQIMQYMDDLPYKGQSTECARTIIQQCIMSHEQLRDEIYCQILKQLTQNISKKTTSEKKGWELLEMCCGCFPSTSAFTPYLKRYLSRVSASSVSPFAAAAKKCKLLLDGVIRNGLRTFPPSEAELSRTQTGTRLIFEIKFPDDSRKKVDVLASDIVSQLLKSICNKLEISTNPLHFALEVSLPQGDEMILAENMYVLDAAALAYGEFSEFEASPPRDLFAIPFRFRKIFWSPQDLFTDSLSVINIMYNQLIHSLSNGDVQFILSNIIVILALQIKVLHVPETGIKNYLNYVPDNVKPIVSGLPQEEILTQLRKKWTEIEEMSDTQARLEFIKIFVGSNLFGGSFYRMIKAKCDQVTLPPSGAILCLSVNGLSLLNTNTKLPYVTYDYQHITSWRYGDEELVITVGGLLPSINVTIRGITTAGNEICHIISKYTDRNIVA